MSELCGCGEGLVYVAPDYDRSASALLFPHGMSLGLGCDEKRICYWDLILADNHRRRLCSRVNQFPNIALRLSVTVCFC